MGIQYFDDEFPVFHDSFFKLLETFLWGEEEYEVWMEDPEHMGGDTEEDMHLGIREDAKFAANDIFFKKNKTMHYFK